MTREEALEFGKMWLELQEDCKDSNTYEFFKMAIEALKQEPCEDAVSRKSVITIIQNHWWNCRDIDKLVNELPPVTPQEPNTWSLDDAREDFMHDVYNTLDFLPTNEEANSIIDIFDRVTSSIGQAPRWIPVTERLPEERLCDDGYVEPSDYVLVWGDYGNYGVSRYWGNRRSKSERPNTHKDWLDLDWVVQKPIAWMPLPQPYKAESEE